jgi:hypothetical protein
MSKLKKDLFVKVMELTLSDEDGEALAALHRARKMITDAGMTRWSELFALWAAPAEPRPQPSPWPHQSNHNAQQQATPNPHWSGQHQAQAQQSQRSQPEPNYAQAFLFLSTMMKFLDDNETNWFNNLHAHWRKKGSLSIKQQHVLDDIITKANRRCADYKAGAPGGDDL